jgi:hypothetical protein
LNYIDLGISQTAKVTFEAENNLDFRLGTGAYKRTKLAEEKDLAIITRCCEYDYEIRIIKKSDHAYSTLLSYATQHVGNKGKRVGYIDNATLFSMIQP